MTQVLFAVCVGALLAWIGVFVGVVIRSGWMNRRLAYKKPKVTP